MVNKNLGIYFLVGKIHINQIITQINVGFQIVLGAMREWLTDMSLAAALPEGNMLSGEWHWN